MNSEDRQYPTDQGISKRTRGIAQAFAHSMQKKAGRRFHAFSEHDDNVIRWDHESVLREMEEKKDHPPDEDQNIRRMMPRDLPDGVSFPEGEWYVSIGHIQVQNGGKVVSRVFGIRCQDTGLTQMLFYVYDENVSEFVSTARVESHGRLSPLIAYQMTLAITSWIERYQKQPEEMAQWRFCNEMRSRLLMARLYHLLPIARILIWQPEIAQASVRGAGAFVGTTLPEDTLKPEPQIWYVDGDYLWNSSEHSPAMAEEFDLPMPCDLQATILLPCVGVDPTAMEGVTTNNWVPDIAFTGRSGFSMGFVFLAKDPGRGPPYFLRFLPAIYNDDEISTLFYANTVAQLQFLSMPFIETQATPLPRPERRRMKRERREEPFIGTIILRHRQSDTHEKGDHSAVDWSCTWIVSGHWRKLHQPRISDGAQTTYVHPYLKGPEGLPLKMPSKRIGLVSR